MTGKREKTVSRSHWLMMEREVAMQVELRSFSVSCEMEKITSTPLHLSLYGFTHPD